jgi:sigma-E factor negative regulatory protein RseB
LLFAGGAIGFTIVAFVAAAQADGANDDGADWSRVVDEARQQMEAESFDGVVSVEWHDAEGVHNAEVQVHQADGVVEVVSGNRSVARSNEGVMLEGRAWTTLSRSRNHVPELTAGKYQILRAPGPDVAGRSTTRYEAVRDGHPVERLYVQNGSGIVLRREVLDASGDVARAVSFVRMTPPSSSLEAERDARPGPVPVADLDRPFHDPARAGDGFRLVGRWSHRADLAQLYYSDGVLSVSVFEQPGTLQWQSLPPGGTDAEVSGHSARRYALPAGEAWVFERDGVVYTCVGDASPAELAALADDVSRPRQHRIERLAEMVLDPIRW